MSSGFFRFVRASLIVVLTVVSAGSVIGYAWYSSEQTTEAQRLETVQRANALVTGLAANYSEQINRQILALDQTLDTLVREWEADPRRFNLETARARSRVLSGISRDMFLADENGIIRQASVSEFIGQSVGDLDVFHDAAEHTNDKPKLYLGGATVNPIMRQWHLDAARTLHHPDGSFAGIIDADYRLSSISDVFASAAPGGNSIAGLIDLVDGKLRVSSGVAQVTPDTGIADTPMFAAVDAAESGLWVGSSASDSVTRIHAFRRVPGHQLAIIVGVDRNDVMQPVAVWRRQSRLFAGAVSGLVSAISILVLGMWRSGRRRAAVGRENQAQLAAAQALAEVARAQAGAISRRLQATFSAVADGIAIFDAHLNLVEWNALFPERSGVNSSFVRTGMPMEDVLRMQAQAGYFGEIEDLDAEVQRRATLLRAGNFGASQSFRAADRVIELRCRPLPEGGIVALYTDVTEGRRARQALRESRDALVREQSARQRFLGVIAFELRALVTPRMWSIVRAMSAPVQVLDRLRGMADDMASLAADAVEVPLMEAGTLTLQPALLTIRTLLRDTVDRIQRAARDRGITVYLIVNETAPAELIADPGRVSQIVTLLLSEAVRSAGPDTIWLLADGGDDNHRDTTALRLTVRGFGTPVPVAELDARFPSIATVAAPEQPMDGTSPAATYGTGLGSAIARHLTTLMGGQLRCESWSTPDGRSGNDFIVTLPPDLLPGQRGRQPGHARAEGRLLPRTRALMIGALTGLRNAAVTMLRRDGHMVDALATLDEATRQLEVTPYDIVFMNGDLPGMAAEKAIGTIREINDLTRTAPVVLLAPPHEETDARAWRDAGATDILTGNPTLEDLVGAISRHVWLSRSSGSRPGFMPGLEPETEEGVPILSAERIAELRANIPPEDLLDMAEECISDLLHRLPALRRALAVGAPGAISAQAHAMVGMAAGYGMAVLEARLRAILTAVRGRRLDTIDGAAIVIENDLARAAAALRRTLRFSQPARTSARS